MTYKINVIVRLAMSERCQKKFTEKFDNKNYIIYLGILCAILAVLYYYRFHLATIAFSYVFGCLACYYGLKSNIFYNYIDKLKCHFVGKKDNETEEVPVKGCETCGSKECGRHDASTSSEPWTGLQIHKQLDQAIEDFYNTILDQFINTWYSKITLQPFFVDELRYQLRYASACLLQRAVKINFARFITHRLVPCALRHVSDVPTPVHPAAANRTSELKYLKCVTNAIMPYVLHQQDLQNPVFKVLIREIFSGWVLLSLTDVLADPYILNTLIILATGDETMAALPNTPNYKVEFLETFVRQTESMYTQRSKLLKIELDFVISDQEYFYAFMQYMKTTSHIHLLQFYNDIKSFQTKILNPELDSAEEAMVQKEARAIHDLYLTDVHRLPLDNDLVLELRNLLNNNTTIYKLQTSRALYQAARQSHAVLEKVMLPRFLHSEEFYRIILGSRIPTGFQKQMVKRPHERLINSAIKLGSKLKGALRQASTIDGQVLDSTYDSDEVGDNVDILKYLDNFALEDELRAQDLSNYKVVLTNVETRLQLPPRRGTVRVFTLAVHRIEIDTAASLWTVERSEHDFHLLRSKLLEFHGEQLLMDLQLPSRRDNSPLETLRYKYEDFLQRLLQKQLLRTSELLLIFLRERGDFTSVAQACAGAGADISNMYHSVALRLRKEKGQHLESFLRSLLLSSDIERYQALKQGTARDVEEALEVSEDIGVEQPVRQRKARDIMTSVFQNNYDTEPVVLLCHTEPQNIVTGFTQCLMYLLTRVIRARGFVCAVIGSVLSLVQSAADEAFDELLNRVLTKVLCERRLAHLIRLGHGVLFGKKSLPRLPAQAQRTRARAALAARVPSAAALGTGAGLQRATYHVFDLIQKPHMNKQLVYNLLDLCIVELFPELATADGQLPKS